MKKVQSIAVIIEPEAIIVILILVSFLVKKEVSRILGKSEILTLKISAIKENSNRPIPKTDLSINYFFEYNLAILRS